jgi:hypothetical protein
MPRQIAIRPSYSSDARFLLKLTEAIQKDDRLSSEKKMELCAHLTASASLLMDVALNLTKGD